jgi:hypothetical protein
MGRIWEYFKANFRIMWAISFEYKANLYMNLIFLTSSTLIGIFISIMLGVVLDEFIKWEFIDFLIFYTISFTVYSFAGFFLWGKGLFSHLTSGEFNKHLYRPLPKYLAYLFNDLEGWAVLHFIFKFITALAIFLYFKVVPLNIGLVLLAILLLNLMHFFVMQLFDSLEFIRYGLSNATSFYFKAYEVMGTNPAPLFQKFPFKPFLYLFEIFFVGSLLVPLIRGYPIPNMMFQFTFIVSVIIISAVLLRIIWHFGLKKYEAYG